MYLFKQLSMYTENKEDWWMIEMSCIDSLKAFFM